MPRSARVYRSPLERVFSQYAERDLVGDRLADQLGAGVEQRLHRPGVSFRNWMGPGPIRVAAAGRTAGDIEQILGREGQAGKRPAGAPGDPEPLARDKGAEIVAGIAHPFTSTCRRGAGSASTSLRSRSGAPIQSPASDAPRAPSSPDGAAARKAPRRLPARGRAPDRAPSGSADAPVYSRGSGRIASAAPPGRSSPARRSRVLARADRSARHGARRP